MSFYDNLKRLCKERGTSPSAIAKQIGLGNSAATYWKRGAIPKHDTILSIADALGCDEWELAPPARAVSHGVLIADMENSRRWKELMDEGYTFSERENSLVLAFSRMNDDGQRSAVQLVIDLSQVPRFKKPEEGDSGAVDPQEN